jgi:hypothetical protein
MDLACGCTQVEGAGGGGGSSLVPAGGKVQHATGETKAFVELRFYQPESPPYVLTGSASGVRANTATVNATVDPENRPTSCEFEYGATTLYEHSAPCSSSPGSGDEPVAVSATLEGLAPETTYHYRVVAGNGAGTSYGEDGELMTIPHEPPTVTGFTPTVGPLAGGQTVTLTGTELEYVTSVSFAGQRATDLEHLSPTSLSVLTPASEEKGEGDVAVWVGANLGERVLAGSYKYVPRPTVSKLGSRKGLPGGGTRLLISGSYLGYATEVLIGSTPARILDATEGSLEIVTPAIASGKYQVRVVALNGVSASSKKAIYDVLGPFVESVSPASGPSAGRAAVRVTGSGFALGSATKFLFGKRAATAVDCTSTTECTMLTPASTKPGAVLVLAEVGKAKSKKSGAPKYTYE